MSRIDPRIYRKKYHLYTKMKVERVETYAIQNFNIVFYSYTTFSQCKTNAHHKFQVQAMAKYCEYICYTGVPMFHTEYVEDSFFFSHKDEGKPLFGPIDSMIDNLFKGYMSHVVVCLTLNRDDRVQIPASTVETFL